MSYAPHQALIEPARKQPALWRLIAGVGLIAAVYILLVVAWTGISIARDQTPMLANTQGATPQSALALLASFLCVFPGLILALWVLHRRRFRSLFGPWRHSLDLGLRVIPAGIAILLLGLALPGADLGDVLVNLPFSVWLSWLAPAILALAVQVTAEEVLFRGYLQSQLAARFQHPLIWLLLPSLIFAALHYSPAEAGANAPWMVLPAFAFGLLAADLTARSGTLGPAIALHFINNFAAILILAPGTALNGLALYRLPVEMSDPALRDQITVELGLMLLLWLAARLAIRR
ncbi:CPBP family intramembrane glutamic endopeptidase [Pseudooceanicola sp.]|uniref:CPBP family intramembrane glutamic endopeptidase n=1 Tax=Pseudooceanicola sp. TaxID=1914328 RepID=UPI00262FE921|nr:CPBP family intramembrane glutamic endopeptidase [Pseudooceanicola sp.]MDF1857227.1 CPBP family intramembrane metalloprotease [Pseudooceanicola sp.]